MERGLTPSASPRRSVIWAGTATTLAMPDYSGLAGWDNAWPPASASTGTWNTIGSGSNITGSVCTENASVKFATLPGTFLAGMD